MKNNNTIFILFSALISVTAWASTPSVPESLTIKAWERELLPFADVGALKQMQDFTRDFIKAGEHELATPAPNTVRMQSLIDNRLFVQLVKEDGAFANNLYGKKIDLLRKLAGKAETLPSAIEAMKAFQAELDSRI